MKLSREVKRLQSLMGLRFVEWTDDKGQQMFINVGGGSICWLKSTKGGCTEVISAGGTSTKVMGSPAEVKAILEA